MSRLFLTYLSNKKMPGDPGIKYTLNSDDQGEVSYVALYHAF